MGIDRNEIPEGDGDDKNRQEGGWGNGLTACCVTVCPRYLPTKVQLLGNGGEAAAKASEERERERERCRSAFVFEPTSARL